MRGFQIVKEYLDKDIEIPARKTKLSAGYDLASAIDLKIEPGEMKLAPTGVKAYFENDEVLKIYIRSSMAVKCGLTLMNNVGIIDADYYDNEKNEGHIFVPIKNLSDETIFIKKGERIAQGIFQKYLLADGDNFETGADRNGGFGSTN